MPTTSSSTTAEPASNSTGKIVIALFLAAGIGAFMYFDLGQYLSLDALKKNRDSLLAYTESNFGVAVALFVGVYIVQTAFSLPGGAILTLAGGFLFGSLLGTVFVNVGATTGATLAFLAARYLLRDWVETKFGDRLEPIQAGFAQNAFSYLMTLRLIPAFPFFLVNLVSGLTRVNLGTYVIATAVGYHSRKLCLCLCRPTTWDHQFSWGNCLTASLVGFYAARTLGTASHCLSQTHGKEDSWRITSSYFTQCAFSLSIPHSNTNPH